MTPTVSSETSSTDPTSTSTPGEEVSSREPPAGLDGAVEAAPACELGSPASWRTEPVAPLDLPAARYDVLVTLIIVGSVLAVVLYGQLSRRLAPRPTGEQCAALLARYVEQASLARDPSIPAAAIASAQIRAQSDPRGLAGLQSCQTSLTRGQVECALHAPGVDELERCTQ